MLYYIVALYVNIPCRFADRKLGRSRAACFYKYGTRDKCLHRWFQSLLRLCERNIVSMAQFIKTMYHAAPRASCQKNKVLHVPNNTSA